MTSIEHLDVGPTATGTERSDEDDHPDSPTIVFLHGLGGSAGAWRPQFEAFASSTRCVAWTMPGYRTSPALTELRPTIADYATSAATFLDSIGIASTAVVGHSLGGFIAQELALARPDLVERLVLVGTTAAFGRPGSSFNDEFLAARLAPLDEGRTPADLAEAVVDGLVGPSTSPEVRTEAADSMAGIGVDGYRQALGALVGHDATDRLPRLRTPTLAIGGELDRTAPVRAMQRLVDLIPESRLAVVEDAGHLLNLERPDQFNALLAEFVR